MKQLLETSRNFNTAAIPGRFHLRENPDLCLPSLIPHESVHVSNFRRGGSSHAKTFKNWYEIRMKNTRSFEKISDRLEDGFKPNREEMCVSQNLTSSSENSRTYKDWC